jgi:hypothetical protein
MDKSKPTPDISQDRATEDRASEDRASDNQDSTTSKLELRGITTVDFVPNLIYVKPGYELKPNDNLDQKSDHLMFKKVTLVELVDMLGAPTVKEWYPKFVIVGRQCCIGNPQTNEYVKIDFDLDYQILKKIYQDDEQLAGMKAKMERYLSSGQPGKPGELSQTGQPLVPPEYKDKYCLLFGGKVAYSADSKEELNRKKAECPYISYTEYIPDLKHHVTT